MSDFFRFPHTPHIAWRGKGMPRDDKVLANHEVEALLTGSVQVEEKLDGANLGISRGLNGVIRVQNRGQYLIEPYTGQFSRLHAWLRQHQETLDKHLPPHLILFGEWCAARHSLDYGSLPDWFLMFDVFDRNENRFWSSSRRNLLANALGLATVPQLYSGNAQLPDLIRLLQTCKSRYRAGPPEGLIIRNEDSDWCQSRAKLVRAEFTQTIDEHWRSRSLEWNRIVTVSGAPHELT